MSKNDAVEIIVRPARPEDIPGMCDLLAELFSLESDFEPDIAKQVKGLSMLVTDPSGMSLVLAAVMGENVIGMGSAQLVVSTVQGSLAGLVEDIIVQKECRRMGTGSRILSGLIQWSTEKGATRLQLLADAQNTSALNFYTGNGWSLTNLVCLRKYL